MNRSGSKDVMDSAFDVVLRGYDKRQVDERLRALGAELATAHNALAAATQRVATLEDALSQPHSGPGGASAGDTAFGARVEKILKLAEDEAREVHAQAEAAAVTLVDQARAEADRLLTAATESAAQRERSSAHELHQLSRLQEEINADLCRVKVVLDTLFEPGGAVQSKRRKDGTQRGHQARTV